MPPAIEGRCAIFPERTDHLPGQRLGKGRIFGAQVSASRITAGILARDAPADVFLPLDDVAKVRSEWRLDAGLYSYHQLADRLANTRYAFGHGQNPGSLHKWRDFRDRYAPAPFPLTATCHTMSYYSMLVDLSWLWLSPTPYDGIACISGACREAVEKMLRRSAELLHPERADGPFPVRLEVIHHGVDLGRFRPRDRAEARRTLGLPLDAGIVLYMGRVSVADKMDLSPLLRAMRRLCSALPERDVLLVIAGEDTHGDTVPMLREVASALRVADRVLFWGAYDPRIAPALYNAADVFVSPSDNVQETFGNTVLEAMASGTLAIAADWNGYRDIVTDGETGWLVPTYWTRCDAGISAASSVSNWKQDHLLLAQSVVLDVGALAERLEWAFRNPARAVEMAERGRRRAEELFSWDSILRRYEDWWEELAAEAARHEACPPTRQAITHDYFGTHSHYATALLEEANLELRLRPMPPGDPERMARFPELVSRAVNLEAVPELLRDLASRASDHITFDELVGIVQRKVSAGTQEARFLACVLLKQGLFELRSGG